MIPSRHATSEAVSMGSVARYMAENYNGKIVPVWTDYCPECLKGGNPNVVNLAKTVIEREKFWESEFNEKRLDPFMVLCSFIPKQMAPGGDKVITTYAHFNKPLINLSQPGERCPEGKHCFPTCIFCNCYVPETQDPKIVTKSDPPFHVHPGCLTQCAYTIPGTGTGQKNRCKVMVPCIPVYYPDFQNGMCKEHAKAMRERAQGGDAVSIHRCVKGKAHVLIRGGMDFAPPTDAQAKVFVPPEKASDAKAKTATKSKTPSKLERLGESKYSHDIRGMFHDKGSEDSKSSVGDSGVYKRPEVVFTPHVKQATNAAKTGKKRAKRTRLSSSDED